MEQGNPPRPQKFLLQPGRFLFLRVSGLVVPEQGINRHGYCQRNNQERVHSSILVAYRFPCSGSLPAFDVCFFMIEPG